MQENGHASIYRCGMHSISPAVRRHGLHRRRGSPQDGHGIDGRGRRQPRHHLDARQFVLTSLALIDGYSAAMLLQGHTSIHPDDVPAAQLRFCQQHMAEIKAMYADG